MPLLRNIDYETALAFAGQVSFQKGQVVSKTLTQNEHVSLTLFAFDQGEEISAHTSKGDALVIALEGKAEVTIGGDKHTIASDDAIVMPAGIPHAVYAQEPFKMFLVVVF